MAELIQRKESKRYPGLFVKKYSRKVFFDALWNTDDALLEARGHVEDVDGNIVVRPFTKIFNRFENNTDIDRDEMVVSIRKVNGFMAAATYVPMLDAVVVSTTGSLDSDFVGYAVQYLNQDVCDKIKSMSKSRPATFLFEICHPEDPHIINEQFGAYLIGCRYVDDETAYFSDQNLEVGLDMCAQALGVLRPDWKVCRFSDVVQEAASCKHEGFVVYGQSSKTSLKIKSPYYLTLKACARKKDIMSLDKQRVDEEYYELIDHLKLNVEHFNSLDEQARLMYIVDYFNAKE